jgi:hypothetical protein
LTKLSAARICQIFEARFEEKEILPTRIGAKYNYKVERKEDT